METIIANRVINSDTEMCKKKCMFYLVQWEDEPAFEIVHVSSIKDKDVELHTGKSVDIGVLIEGKSELVFQRGKIVSSSDDSKYLDKVKRSMEQEFVSIQEMENTNPSATIQHVNNTANQSIETKTKKLKGDVFPRLSADLRYINGGTSNKKYIAPKIEELQPNVIHTPLSKRDRNQNFKQEIESKQAQQKISSSPIKTEKERADYMMARALLKSRYIKNQKTDTVANVVKGVQEVTNEWQNVQSALQDTIQDFVTNTSLSDCNDDAPNGDNDSDDRSEDGIVNRQCRSSRSNSSGSCRRPMESSSSANSNVDAEDRHSSLEPEDIIINEGIEMVAIGPGGTRVPKYKLDSMDWTSYTMVTRKLMLLIFPRRTMASHSLTGKASPAFANRPQKPPLDPTKVDDIVWIVTRRCGVNKSIVRTAITNKCADEFRMLRNRKARSAQKKAKRDQENIAPSSE